MKKLHYFFFLFLSIAYCSSLSGQTVFINELHYDNAGGDVNEGIEIIAPAGTDLSCYSIVLYNGGNNLQYGTTVLSGVIGDEGCGTGTIWFPIANIQNGGSDGICLYNTCSSSVIQFLSYEGVITAGDGVASGQTSTDIGVSESGTTPIGDALQLAGIGTSYTDFTWGVASANSTNSINAGQTYCIGCGGIVAEPTIDVTGVGTSLVNCNSGTINWTIGVDANNGIVVYSSSPITGIPIDGVDYSVGDFLAAGEEVIYNGAGSSVILNGLADNITYYYGVFEYAGNSPDCEENYLVGGVTGSFTTTTPCPAIPASIVINEISQGTSGNQEYVELIVTGPIACEPADVLCLDLRGWILDDNGGFFNGSATGGVGIAAGAVRFANDPFWSCVPAGTRILVYNDGDLNPDVAPIDIDLADGNCSLVLPVSSALFENHPTLPSSIDMNYPSTGWISGGSWTQISMANGQDGFQIYDPTDLTDPVFAVGWGSGSGQTNNLGNIYMGSSTAAGDVFSFNNTNSDDPFDQSNWDEASASTNQTPGTQNNNDNYDWMVSMNPGCRIPLVISLTPAAATCGACNGSATSSVTGDVTPYTYDWSTASTGISVNALCPGTYDLTITDALGCTITESTTIVDIPDITITSAVVQNESCNGFCDGQATASITGGGVTPYYYLWSNGATDISTSGLCDGVYSVTITDGNSCISASSVTVTSGGSITAVANPLFNQCLDGNSFTFGSVGSVPIPGVGVTYDWYFDDGGTGSGTSPTHTYTTAGTYDITLTVSDGICSDDAIVQVTVHPMPTVTLDPTDVTCNGLADGELLATGGGGTPSYTYLWGALSAVSPNAGATDTETGLGPGTYTVTISDGNSCAVSATADIVEDPAVTLTMSGNDANCNGASTGEATVTVVGGLSGYTYLWNNVQISTTSAIYGLVANTYSVSVSDLVGCTTVDSWIVNDPSAVSATINSVDEVCGCDGQSTAAGSGSSGSYSYEWFDASMIGIGQTTDMATGLCAGDYNVVVTSAIGCNTTAATTIDFAIPLIASGVSTDENCACDGSAVAAAVGSGGGYTYTWYNDVYSPIGQTGFNASNLCGGTYNIIVESGEGCIDTASVFVAPAANSFGIDSVTFNGTNCQVYMTYCAESGDVGGSGASNTGAFGFLSFGEPIADWTSPIVSNSNGATYNGYNSYVWPATTLINATYPAASGFIGYFLRNSCSNVSSINA